MYSEVDTWLPYGQSESESEHRREPIEFDLEAYSLKMRVYSNIRRTHWHVKKLFYKI